MKKIAAFAVLSALSSAMTQPCLSAQAGGRFIDVSPDAPRYFRQEDGRFWLPVGCNICWEWGYRTDEDREACEKRFHSRMRRFAANGGNFMRIWLGHAFFEVMPAKAGEYDSAATDTLKRTVRLAEELGIKIKFTLENFRTVRPEGSLGNCKRSLNRSLYAPYVSDMPGFFTSEKCFDIYLGKARYLKSLGFGDSPSVICWELWNEINAMGPICVYSDWSDKAMAALRELFPRQMVTQNLGSFADPQDFLEYDYLAGLDANSYMQAHRYLDPAASLDVCRGPMDVLCADVVRELLDRRPDRPALLAETGAVLPGHAGPSDLYAVDKKGMLLHDELFAPFFAGSAGSGQPWHWDGYIDRNGLWWHFGLFAKAVKGLDPVAEDFRPFRTETRRLRIYGLRGRRTTVFWCRDKKNTWQAECRDGVQPETLQGIELPFDSADGFSVYLPWENKTVPLPSGRCRLPPFQRSCVVRFSRPRTSAIELEWTMPDGRVECETRALPERDGVATFALSREEIASRGATSLAVTPDFARAHKGDDGFWVFSSGECGTFRCDEGKAECRRWQLMSVYGMKTPERTFAAIVKKLKYYFTTRVTVKDGEYRMGCVLGEDLCRAPYEDFEIEFRRLEGKDATMGGIARTYRNYQFARGVAKPLRERIASNSVLKDAIDGPEIRIRQAWKPVPPKVLEQTPETEPPVTPYVTFDRVVDIARELKSAGVEKAELCLVGWNVGGHDGRWPQSFPAEPVLGGDEKLKDCVKAVRDMGYLIVPHGNYLDAYRIADSWDEEWLAKTADGGFLTSGNWGGGKSARICAQRAYERFASRDMWRMGEYGFRGLGYFDVVSIIPADECHDSRHPLNRAEAAKWWGRGAALSKRVFGGFASEGAFDHFVGDLDSALYVSFNDPRKEKAGLVDRMSPFPQLVYNGVFAMNPFTRTVNFTAQERYWQLKLIEFGGRPTFYFYSKFKHDGKNWMGDGDLGCATEDELKAAVGKIKAGWDVYRELSHLQCEFMEEHDDLGGGVWRTTYSNGERLYVNYSDASATADGLPIPAKGWRLVQISPRHVELAGVPAW